MKVIINYANTVIYDISCLDMLAKGIPVERNGYGSDAKYLPKKETLDFEIIHDHQLVVEEKETIEMLRKKITDAETQKSNEWNRAYNAEKKAKELQEELDKLKALCPHNNTDTI